MDTTLLIMAILVVILPTAMLTSMFLLRGGSAHSERIAREQEQLDRKNGIASRTRTASTNADESKRFDWIKSKPGLNLLFVIIGAVALYWGFNTQMRPTDVGSWSYGKWLPLLIFWGIGAALIALNAEEKTATTLQKMLMWVMLALLIALPVWSWIVTPSATPQQATRSEIPLASSPQSSWPKLAVPAGGKSEVIPLPPDMRVIWAGYQFRNYTVYPGGHECAFNGTTPCPNGGTGTYANNEANVVNVVAYAFAPI